MSAKAAVGGPDSKMILVSSKTSPYSRRLKLLVHGRAEFEIKTINYLEIPADAAYLKSISPINKIPVLIDGEDTIFESRVIANYISDKLLLPAFTIEEENVLSMIDAANDVAVNLFLLRRGGMDIDLKSKNSNWYIERQKERVPEIFDHLEPWAKTRRADRPEHWNYVAMSLYSYVDWAIYREMADFSRHPGLVDFVTRFNAKPGVAETSPRS